MKHVKRNRAKKSSPKDNLSLPHVDQARSAVESRGRRTSAFALVTGSPPNRQERVGKYLTRIR